MVCINIPSKVYRPKPLSSYCEPKLGNDMLYVVWVHQNFGNPLKQSNADLPLCTDMVEFNVQQDITELNTSIKLTGLPTALKPKIIATIKEY